jgi:hypothetical protein
LDDGVVALRFGRLEGGSVLIEVTFAGGDRLEEMYADKDDSWAAE